MRNVRRTLAIKIQTPGGDNPLLLDLVSQLPYFRGVPVSGLALVARGGTPPYAYTILSGGDSSGQINGLTLHTDGTITGTPTAAGHFVFVAQVQDSDGSVFPHGFAIDFKSQFLVVRGTPVPGEEGIAYSYQMVVRDLTGTTITSGYTLASGNLPDGLTINSAGTITGTPTALAIGISYATINVTNGTDSLDISINITVYEPVTLAFEEDRDPPNNWGGGAGSWLPSMVRGIPYLAHLVITGGLGPYSLSVLVGDPLPTGINLNNSHRVINGKTMDAADLHPKALGIGVTDALGGFESAIRAFFIIDSNQGRIRPQKDGVDIGADGPQNFNFEINDDETLAVENDGLTTTVKLPKPSTGGGVQSVNGVGPDSYGNVNVPTGDNITINGVLADSSGNIELVSDDDSVGINQNSNGNLDLSARNSGGISLMIGRPNGPILEADTWRTITLPASYAELSEWEIFVSPPGSLEIDVRYSLFGTTEPDAGDSIVGGTYPATTGGATNIGTTSGWTLVEAGIRNFLQIYIRNNDVVRFFLFNLTGKRVG